LRLHIYNMLERDLGLKDLRTPEARELTSLDIQEIFEIDYRQLVEDILNKADIFQTRGQLTFFHIPKRHKGSEAYYLVEEMLNGGHIVYLSYLKPDSKTTVHKHPDSITESYFQLAGSSFLKLDNNFLELRQGYALTVLQDAPHQLITRDAPSLTFIIMRNAGLVQPEKLHIPVVL